MNLEERILQRKRRGDRRQLLLEETSLSPVWHPSEPTGRGPTIERLLDRLEPVFDHRTPENVYVRGPAGSGKSAVVTALFEQLSRLLSSPEDTIVTTTRGGSASRRSFAYVDLREATSRFEFYHAILSATTTESVPRRGLATIDLRQRVSKHLRGGRVLVVAMDHADDDTDRLASFAGELESLGHRTAWVAVGRGDPKDVLPDPRATSVVGVDPYHAAELTDVLTARISTGLARDATTHQQVRRLSTWADGDAHDALAALLGAVDVALEADSDVLEDAHLDAGIESVPKPCVSLGRVLALSENRRAVLRALVVLDAEERSSVSRTAAAIAASSSLSESTITRYLYEFAENGIVERVPVEGSQGAGRPPSRVETRVPTRAFRRLTRGDD
ncbi:Cdc6/Cdc18 family protein [Halogeometricum limi]|uniref:Cdc6-related protein, AAA superfamily ATPase n=1 Tax=Halogeometricum limi TaxID=555875 RepID=A0A1I6IT47_9EURY|nr:AAA family ATPase [Halogeometricum limi]SFR69809.1 Cdc6-related protein, AAA superfamily ATPase [Halogeometricum limi]